jgi:hypothetical protein
MTDEERQISNEYNKKLLQEQLVYLMAPYSSVADKDRLMKVLYTVAHDFMRNHPGAVVVSPLFYHYSVGIVPGVDGDWQFWENYSINLLRKCDGTIMVQIDGWENSIGVKAETELQIRLNIPVLAVYDNDGIQVR